MIKNLIGMVSIVLGLLALAVIARFIVAIWNAWRKR